MGTCLSFPLPAVQEAEAEAATARQAAMTDQEEQAEAEERSSSSATTISRFRALLTHQEDPEEASQTQQLQVKEGGAQAERSSSWRQALRSQESLM